MDKIFILMEADGMIEARRLSQRELVRRLREIVDRLTDPTYRITDPEGYAVDYHVMVALSLHHRKALDSAYVQHNLGERRLRAIWQAVEVVGQDMSHVSTL